MAAPIGCLSSPIGFHSWPIGRLAWPTGKLNRVLLFRSECPRNANPGPDKLIFLPSPHFPTYFLLRSTVTPEMVGLRFGYQIGVCVYLQKCSNI